MELLLLFMAGFCLLYALVFIVQAKKMTRNIRFHHLGWLLAAGFFICFYFVQQTFGLVLSIISDICLIVFLLLVLFYGSQILMQIGQSKKHHKFDYILILGAKVIGAEPSSSLILRLNAALKCMESQPSAQIILSGGRHNHEIVSEASVMEQYLLQQGIAPNRMVKEEDSQTTEDNIRFSLAFIGSQDASVGIVTNSFHLYRAVRIARRYGLQNAFGVYAQSNYDSFIHYFFREIFILAFADGRCMLCSR